jgi:hypothetical protein
MDKPLGKLVPNMTKEEWYDIVLPEIEIFADCVTVEQAKYDLHCTISRLVIEHGLLVPSEAMSEVIRIIIEETLSNR